MKPRFIFLTVGLVTAIVLSACAPAVTSPPAALTETSVPAAPADSSSPEAIVFTPTPAAEVQAVATSRGPNLESTDPFTVNLASGQLQLVEFFRFT